MKVLLLFQHLRYENERGGQRSREIAEFLATQDAEVIALIPNVDPLTGKKAIPDLLLPWRYFRDASGYREYRFYVPATARKGLPGRLLYSAFCFFNVLLFLLVHGRKLDVIITTTHPLLMAIAALPIKWLSATKLVIEVRDIPLDVAIERKIVSQNGILSKCYRFFEGMLFKNADHVISYSQQMLELLSQRYRVSSSSIIPIGTGEIDFVVDKASLVNREVKICFFGTLGKVLSLSSMFDLAVILKNKGLAVRLDIYGDGESRQALLDESCSLGLDVKFNGVVPKNMVVERCSEYDFAIYPVDGGEAISASLGNKFFDYVTARTPIVVIGKNSEAGRIVKEVNVGLVNEDLTRLADDIINVVDMAIDSKQSTSSFFKFENAITMYSKEGLYKQFYRVVQSLVA
ncbi:MAG: glycosyltransferase [Cyclobacteriaceae bacterium]|nr:glycosyltransferase [Cyclobacteriaceae bacterium]